MFRPKAVRYSEHCPCSGYYGILFPPNIDFYTRLHGVTSHNILFFVVLFPRALKSQGSSATLTGARPEHMFTIYLGLTLLTCIKHRQKICTAPCASVDYSLFILHAVFRRPLHIYSLPCAIYIQCCFLQPFEYGNANFSFCLPVGLSRPSPCVCISNVVNRTKNRVSLPASQLHFISCSVRRVKFH